MTVAAAEAVAAPAQVSASEPTSDAKDQTAAPAEAGAKRPIESGDDAPASKASKDDE